MQKYQQTKSEKILGNEPVWDQLKFHFSSSPDISRGIKKFTRIAWKNPLKCFLLSPYNSQVTIYHPQKQKEEVMGLLTLHGQSAYFTQYTQRESWSSSSSLSFLFHRKCQIKRIECKLHTSTTTIPFGCFLESMSRELQPSILSVSLVAFLMGRGKIHPSETKISHNWQTQSRSRTHFHI